MQVASLPLNQTELFGDSFQQADRLPDAERVYNKQSARKNPPKVEKRRRTVDFREVGAGLKEVRFEFDDLSKVFRCSNSLLSEQDFDRHYREKGR